MKALLSLVILIALGIAGLIVYAKYFYNQDTPAVLYYADELPVNKESYKKEFEEIHQITLDNYSLYQSKHLNMDSLYQSCIKRITNQASNATTFGLILKEYFAALHAGHASVHLKDYTADYAPLYIEGRISSIIRMTTCQRTVSPTKMKLLPSITLLPPNGLRNMRNTHPLPQQIAAD